jgi:hypothetical protein
VTRSAWLFATLLLASMVAVAACNSDEATSREPTATPAIGDTATAPASTPPPSTGPGRGSPPAGPPHGAIEISGETFPLGLGTYCWTTARGGQCVDAVGVITAFPHAEAAPGDAVALTGPLSDLDLRIDLVRFSLAPPEPFTEQDGWQAWQPARETSSDLRAVARAVTLPDDLEPGRYVIEFHVARADVLGHSATYGAIIEVTE